MMNIPVSARAALLRALTAGPGYGLELVERVSAATGGRLVLGAGSVYPALAAMERDGWAVEVAQTQAGGRVYRLTAKGAKVAAEQAVTLTGLLAMGERR